MQNTNECSNESMKMPVFMSGFAAQKYHVAEEGVVYAASKGCTHWYIDGSIHSDSATEWDNNRISSMQDKIQRYGVNPIFHGNFKAPVASDVPELRKASVEYIKKEIDLCAHLNAPLIVHAGGVVEPRKVNVVREKALNGYIESIRELTEYAAGKGVQVWLENLCNYQKFHPFYYIFTNYDEYEFILSEVDNVSFIFDVCHETVGKGDPLYVFDKLHHRISAFSFSDTMGDRDSHMPLGTGIIDYTALVRRLIAKDWLGVIAFETRGVEVDENIRYLNGIMQNLMGDNQDEMYAAQTN